MIKSMIRDGVRSMIRPMIRQDEIPVPLELNAVAWYNFRDSSKLIGGAVPTIDVAGWKDSAVTNVEVSGDLVTNGDFNTNLSGWTVQNTDANNTITWDNGAVHIVSDSTTVPNLRLRQSCLNSGSWHKIKFDVVEATGSNNLRLQNSGTILVDNIPNVIGSYEYIVYATSVDLRFTNAGRTDVNIKLDNVEVYELDPATVAYDLSQGTASNQPTFTQPNGPVVFDGSDYLDGIPNKVGDFTYVFKVNRSVTTLLTVLGADTNANRIQLTTINSIRLATSSGNVENYPAVVNINVDYVIALTRTGNDYSMYLDGTLLDTRTVAEDFQPTWLGRRDTSSGFFNGKIYEFVYFDESKSSSQITQLTDWMNR